MLSLRSLVPPICKVATIAAILLLSNGAPALQAQVSSQVSSSDEYHSMVDPGDAAPLHLHALEGNGQAVPAYGYPSHSPWVSHFAAKFGGGFTTPADEDQHDLTYGWNVVAGAGYRFDRNFSMIGEYQFDSNKIPAKVLAQVGEPGGYVHIWSLTLNPVWDYKTGGSWGGYLTGGGGFYRKYTAFTQPGIINSYYCDFFFCYPYDYTGNVVVSHFATSQGGMNIGGGFTFGNWSGGKFFSEARYTWIDTPGRATRVVPVTFGFRW
ncbi:MAG TPA: hypothetical protein VM554_07330 [Acidisarcina sp.]|nr:hypothetical protein [Acidisarcina sp.]